MPRDEVSRTANVGTVGMHWVKIPSGAVDHGLRPLDVDGLQRPVVLLVAGLEHREAVAHVQGT